MWSMNKCKKPGDIVSMLYSCSWTSLYTRLQPICYGIIPHEVLEYIITDSLVNEVVQELHNVPSLQHEDQAVNQTLSRVRFCTSLSTLLKHSNHEL